MTATAGHLINDLTNINAPRSGIAQRFVRDAGGWFCVKSASDEIFPLQYLDSSLKSSRKYFWS